MTRTELEALASKTASMIDCVRLEKDGLDILAMVEVRKNAQRMIREYPRLVARIAELEALLAEKAGG